MILRGILEIGRDTVLSFSLNPVHPFRPMEVNFSSPGYKSVLAASLVAIMVLFGVSHPSLRAQTKLEKAAWVSGGAVALGIYDYFGYNLTKRSSVASAVYRSTFFLAQGIITYILYEKFGLPSAIGFNLIWWTFGVDMVFYGVCEMNTNTRGSWGSRGAWAEDSWNGIGHAYFTPIGLLRGARTGNRIATNTIVAQAIAGGLLGISISIVF